METAETLASKLAAVPRAAERRRRLMRAPKRQTLEMVRALYAEVVRLSRVELKQAASVASTVRWLADRAGDAESRALAFRITGHVHYLKGKYQDALTQYDLALAEYTVLANELEIGLTINGALQTLIYLGRYDEAFAAAERARTIFSALGDRLRLARLDTNLGNVLHRQDRFEEALELYRRAYAAFAEVGSPQDVAITLRNMAVCHISLNDFRNALETYYGARTYCESNQMPLLVAEADYNIAYLHYLRGEYTRAIELYQATREHCIRLGDAYHQGLCDLDQAEMVLELNLSEEGAALAQSAYNTFRKLGTGYEAAKALANLAVASNQLGDSPRALELFRRARQCFADEKNHVWCALTDLYQAIVLYQAGSRQEARTLCRRALHFFDDSPLSGKAVLCRLLLARIHLDRRELTAARIECTAAMLVLERFESPWLRYQAYFVLGQIAEACGYWQEAYGAYQEAHRKLETLRSHIKAEELKIAFLSDKVAVHESLVWMSSGLERPSADDAASFTYIEEAKSRTLADLIAFRAQSLPAATRTQPALVEQVRALREELNWYSRSIELTETRSWGPMKPDLELLTRRAQECEQRLTGALESLSRLDREFTSLQAGGSNTVEAIRAALPEDAALLEFYQAREIVYACVLDRRNLRVLPVAAARDVHRDMQLLRFQMSRLRHGAGHPAAFQQQIWDATQAHLRALYARLIQPVERFLDAAHLVVAPHSSLHYLPFAALAGEDGYLVDRFSISYAPSGSVFHLCATKEAGAAEGALVLGVPDPSAPRIEEEVAAVAESLPGAEVYLGAAATLEVLRTRGASSRLIHLATHGHFRQDNPMFSSIRLGDCNLSLYDLYQLNLSAELVTLSGCGTGLNVVVGGDELLGLVRGLLYAGAQCLQVTLWDVNDESTAEFMKLFYRELPKAANKALAMRNAMRELRETRPQPYYWAPFCLVGKYY